MARKRRRTRKTRSRRRNPQRSSMRRYYIQVVDFAPGKFNDRVLLASSPRDAVKRSRVPERYIVNVFVGKGMKQWQLVKTRLRGAGGLDWKHPANRRTRNASGTAFVRNLPPLRRGRYPNPARQRIAMRGADLHPVDRDYVLRAYVYRMTTEAQRRWPEVARRMKAGGWRMPERSDAQWMRETYFKVKKNGRLDKSRRSTMQKYEADVILEPMGRWPTANPRRRRRR